MAVRGTGIPDVPPTDPVMREFLSQMRLAVNKLTDRVTDAIGEEDPTPEELAGDLLPPGAPENLTGTCTSGVINLSWDNASDEDLVAVEVWENATGTLPDPGPDAEDMLGEVVASAGTRGTYARAGLNIGDVRYYWVRSKDEAGNFSEFNDETGLSITVTGAGSDDDGDAPGVISDLTAIPGINSIWLQWTSPADEDLARVDFYEALTTGSSATATRVGSSGVEIGQQTAWRRGGLSPGVTRYYWAKTVDRDGNESGFSNEASATTGSTDPEDLGTLTGLVAPTGTNVTSTLITDTDGSQIVTVNVTWNAIADDRLAYYEIGISINGGAFIVHPVNENRYSFNVPGAAAVEVKVRAVDIYNHITNWTTIYSHTATSKTAAPGVPSSLAITAGIGTLYLSWTNPSDADIHSTEVWENTTNNSGTATKIATVNAAPGQPGRFARTGLGTDVTRYYWIKGRDTSGNTSAFSSGVSATTAKVLAGDITVNSVLANSIVSNVTTTNVLNANVIQSTSTLPGSLVVGSTGYTLTTLGAAAADPATAINANTTQIGAGKILISGSTTLANWRAGGDLTKITGGSIAANTIAANAMKIGQRGIEIRDIVFEHNTSTQGSGVATTNACAWSSGRIFYVDDSGSPVSVAISAGNATYSGTMIFIYWVKDATTLSNTTNTATAYNANNVILATYNGGVKLVANYGGTIIDGANITTGSITANQIHAGTITGDRIASNTITGNLIQAGTIVADNIFTGTLTAEKIVGGGLTTFLYDEATPNQSLTTTMTAISGLSRSLTTYDDDTVLIQLTWNVENNEGTRQDVYYRIYRDSTILYEGISTNHEGPHTDEFSRTWVDRPPAMSNVVYTVRMNTPTSVDVVVTYARIDITRMRR